MPDPEDVFSCTLVTADNPMCMFQTYTIMMELLSCVSGAEWEVMDSERRRHNLHNRHLPKTFFMHTRRRWHSSIFLSPNICDCDGNIIVEELEYDIDRLSHDFFLLKKLERWLFFRWDLRPTSSTRNNAVENMATKKALAFINWRWTPPNHRRRWIHCQWTTWIPPYNDQTSSFSSKILQ